MVAWGTLTAITLVGIAAASAAQLGLGGSGPGAFQDTKCTTASVATEGGATHTGANYTSVELTDIPASCVGLDVEVVVYDSSGNSIATGTGTVTTAPMDVTTTTYNINNAAGVALLVDTWGVPTTWDGVVLPAISCVSLNNGGNPWSSRPCSVSISGSSGTYPNSNPPGGDFMNFTFNVTTTAPHWRVTIDFSNGGTFPWQPMGVGQYGNQVQLASGYSCSSPVSTLIIEDTPATWGATLYVGENGLPSWWGGGTLCP